MDGAQTRAFYVVRAIGRPAGYRHGCMVGAQTSRDFFDDHRRYKSASQSPGCRQSLLSRAIRRGDAVDGQPLTHGTVIRLVDHTSDIKPVCKDKNIRKEPVTIWAIFMSRAKRLSMPLLRRSMPPSRTTGRFVRKSSHQTS